MGIDSAWGDDWDADDDADTVGGESESSVDWEDDDADTVSRESESSVGEEASNWRALDQTADREMLEAQIRGATRVPIMIVLKTMVAVLAAQELSGMICPQGFPRVTSAPGNPYQGGCLQSGSQDFIDVAGLLSQATAPSWTGAGADAYNAANATLVTQAQSMSDLDLQFENAVADHATAVSKTQDTLGGVLDSLVVTLAIVTTLTYLATADGVLTLDGLPFLERAFWIARAAAVASISTATGAMIYCTTKSFETQKKVDGINYDAVMNAAQAVAPS